MSYGHRAESIAMKLLLQATVLTILFLPLFLSAQTIPGELLASGFDQDNLINYEQDDNLEYFTFSDWRTDENGDIVTFVLEKGEVIDVFLGVENKVFSKY